MQRTRCFAVLVAVAICGCSSPADGPELDTRFEVVGQLHDASLREVSGIVASRTNPGMFYVHNDSGDRARVYLIDRDGATRCEIRLQGAHAVDYEDIAIAPGSNAGHFDVCVADIGDNRARRPTVTIYRFAEISLEDDTPRVVDVRPKTFEVRYADGPADAEAFVVDPRTGHGYVFTKRLDGMSYVYKLPSPWPTGSVTELQHIATITLPPAVPRARIITAADVSPKGNRLIVRCYVNGWQWTFADGGLAFDQSPARVTLALEPQGEAVCYTHDGASVITVSEGVHAALYSHDGIPSSQPAHPSP